MHILVLAGGNSDERDVSLRSGAAVSAALQAAGHTVAMLDPTKPLDSYLDDFKTAEIIFPALHGAGGEDGTVQAFCETHNIKCVGSDSKSSELCFDKARFERLLDREQILSPKTELVDAEAYRLSALATQPHVLKPNNGGSSIDTIIVRTVNARDETAIADTFARHRKLLLQELIEGTEITVAIIGKQPLPVIEIIPPSDQEFDYENKYNGATQEICPPQHVDAKLQTEAQTLAQRIHDLSGCRDMSRTDIIISKDRELFVLETNTIPGLTTQSLLPKAAAAAGMPMAELCDQLVQLAAAH